MRRSDERERHRRERTKEENGNAVETRATGGGKSGQCYFVDLTVQTARALSGAVLCKWNGWRGASRQVRI